MKSKLMIGIVAGGMVGVSALAFTPLVANAEVAQVQSRNSGSYGLHDGTGGYGQQGSLASRAQVLGMTTEQLKTALQTQTVLQIAESKGMTQEQFQAKMQDAASARWEARGLSAEEIQQRTETQQQNQADCDGTGGGMYRGQN